MTGRSRLPGGQPRKASQRNSRRAGAAATRVTPTWRLGNRVHWQGTFRRALSDGEHVEIVIEQRVYRVRINESG
jgi:hypothetical protein